jgi:hypothetical protein
MHFDVMNGALISACMITAVSGGSLVTGEDAEADVGNNFVFLRKGSLRPPDLYLERSGPSERSSH